MHLDRIFSVCPYLTGSLEGVVCSAALTLLRNLKDVNPDICISRHFEICHLYISKLLELESPVDVDDSNGCLAVNPNENVRYSS
jgi:hypothetical protein